MYGYATVFTMYLWCAACTQAGIYGIVPRLVLNSRLYFTSPSLIPFLGYLNEACGTIVRARCSFPPRNIVEDDEQGQPPKAVRTRTLIARINQKSAAQQACPEAPDKSDTCTFPHITCAVGTWSRGRMQALISSSPFLPIPVHSGPAKPRLVRPRFNLFFPPGTGDQSSDLRNERRETRRETGDTTGVPGLTANCSLDQFPLLFTPCWRLIFRSQRHPPPTPTPTASRYLTYLAFTDGRREEEERKKRRVRCGVSLSFPLPHSIFSYITSQSTRDRFSRPSSGLRNDCLLSFAHSPPPSNFPTGSAIGAV